MSVEGSRDPSDTPPFRDFADLISDETPQLMIVQNDNTFLGAGAANRSGLESNEDTSFKQVLVLQPHLGSQTNCSPFDMGAFGSGLMSSAPV